MCCSQSSTASSGNLRLSGSVRGSISPKHSLQSGVQSDGSGNFRTALSSSNVVPARRGSQIFSKTRTLEMTGLLEQYDLGEILGYGSYSIVLSCRARSVDHNPSFGGAAPTYAVKLIERIEAVPEDIEQETQIHVKLEHPNILKLHRIFFEKCFVCMVLDHYKGGSLVSLLHRHHTSKKTLVSGRIVHLGRQMVQAVEYIHTLSIAHRDIKADNFLADRKELTNPNCCVVLADFGFAVECRLGDRLRRQCGTGWYWAPEVWDKNYALKADLWALGVTFYGLVEGSFPFRSEWDVKNKEVTCYRAVSPTLNTFIKQLLCKQEGRRLSATQAIFHPWISRQHGEEPEDVHGSLRPGNAVLPEVYPDLPDAGTAERRRELLGRLTGSASREFTYEISQGSFDADLATPKAVLAEPSFTVRDKRAGKTRTFEWWSAEKMASLGVFKTGDSEESRSAGLLELGVQTQIFTQLLEDFGVDTSRFGRGDAKSLERFAQEVESGFSQLMLDAAKHKALVRVVEVVLLRICLVRPGQDEQFMVVSHDEQPDGRVRGSLNRLPGTKKLPHENVRNAAMRTLTEIPAMAGANVAFDFDSIELFEVEEVSPSYPGVRTVYRKEIVAGVIRHNGAFATSSFHSLECFLSKGSDEDPMARQKSTKFFSWLTEEECFAKNVTLTAPNMGKEVCSLVPAPMGLKVEALGKFLTTNRVDLTQFGKGAAKPLQDLSDELLQGECTLKCLPDGRVARVVDVVLLRIVQTGTMNILVVAKEVCDGSGHEPCDEILRGRLPGTKRRPDESQFKAAKRVLQRQINLSENEVNFDKDNVHIVEEEKDSPSYPGLHTIYRKRIIPAYLDLFPGSYRARTSLRPYVIPEEPLRRFSGSSSNVLSEPSSPRPGQSIIARFRRNMGSMGQTFSRGRK